MNWNKVFLSEDPPRPIFRFFLSAALIVLAYSATTMTLSLAFSVGRRRMEGFTGAVWGVALLLAALLGVCRFLTGVMEGKPLGSIGLALHGRWKTELGIGLAVGAMMILWVATVESLSGGASFAWNASLSARGAGSGLLTGAVLAIAAMSEELMFRGYPFQRLVEAVGDAGAVGLSSVLFGLVHLRNPHHTLLSTLNTTLMGVPLAVAYLRTRSLWSPIGLHFSWNFVQGFVLGLPVSGIVLPQMVLKARVHDFDWLTGGSYGPEAGVPTSVVIILATAYLLVTPTLYLTEETRQLVFGNAGRQQAPLPVASRVSASGRPPKTGGTV
jgi:CAAX protease family protein